MPGIFDIPEFKPGQDIRGIRGQLNQLRRAVLALRPCNTGDIKATCTENGTTMRLGKKILASGTDSSTCPFDITLTSDGLGGYIATFQPGTINQLLPSNYLTGVTVPAAGTRYLVLSCTASSGAITAAAFSASSTAPAAIAPTAGTPPNSFELLIGVCINAAATKVWGCGNIQAVPSEAFRLQKATPLAGELPYDVYYTWSFSLIA